MDSGSHLINSRLVVVGDVTPPQMEAAFTLPEVAVETIKGLRSGRALIDNEGFFAAIQRRAQAFQWNNEMQKKANRWASQEMVGWIEEVHKGLEGLRQGDAGRLLHARFGCSWGLARVICVQRGILLSSDNALYEEVTAAVGYQSQWTALLRAAYGAGPEPSLLADQVKAGLQLYRLTAVMLSSIILAEHRSLIDDTVRIIADELSFSSPLTQDIFARLPIDF